MQACCRRHEDADVGVPDAGLIAEDGDDLADNNVDGAEGPGTEYDENAERERAGLPPLEVDLDGGDEGGR